MRSSVGLRGLYVGRLWGYIHAGGRVGSGRTNAPGCRTCCSRRPPPTGSTPCSAPANVRVYMGCDIHVETPDPHTNVSPHTHTTPKLSPTWYRLPISLATASSGSGKAIPTSRSVTGVSRAWYKASCSVILEEAATMFCVLVWLDRVGKGVVGRLSCVFVHTLSRGGGPNCTKAQTRGTHTTTTNAPG